jgi:hypothetical protein
MRPAPIETEEQTERPTAQQRLDALNQAHWSTWSASVNEKLAELDAFVERLVGKEDDDGKSENMLSMIIAQTLEETDAAASKGRRRFGRADRSGNRRAA